MKNHTKVYMKFFGFDVSDFIPCEVCGARCIDVHHIESRGMGGSSDKDHPVNLMGLCRECHVEYGDKAQYMDFLQLTHRVYTLKNAV
jgi:HNH endonuclease